MSPDTLVYMANRIGKYFAGQHRRDPVAGIAGHPRKFRDPVLLAVRALRD